MKKNKAITLIALIVTIIVLLVLAGVSITMLSGDNGILNKAKTAKDTSDSAGVDEENKLGKTNDIIDTFTTSRSGGIGDKTKLWEGNVISTGSVMNLSNSIENYKYILIKDKWESTSSTEIRCLEVADVLKAGYFTDTSNYRNSHMFISPYSTYFAYITFKSSTLAIISNENGDAVQIIGIYGVN